VRCRVGAAGEGADVVVATCHLGFGRPGEGARQLAATLDWLERAAGPDRPAVLLGDLNLRHPVAPPGWTLVEVPPAFPSWVPDRRIDHVLVHGPVTATAVPDLGRQVVSDHRPVAVDLSF
jgi:endonuclease/exonuclease/phosphatase family metal-dependent hydrolase